MMSATLSLRRRYKIAAPAEPATGASHGDLQPAVSLNHMPSCAVHVLDSVGNLKYAMCIGLPSDLFSTKPVPHATRNALLLLEYGEYADDTRVRHCRRATNTPTQSEISK